MLYSFSGAVFVLVGVVSVVRAEGPIELRDVTSQTGIRFVHSDGSGGNRYIVETVASGLATFDYDGDGRIDIYFLNGRPLRGTRLEGPPPTNRLYRNLGGWKFVDVTGRTGVGDAGYGLGVAAADYDNDGLADLYVNNYGPNVLYRNRGDGTFDDVTAEAGVARGDTVGAGANFLDIDGDGLLDLFVANYVQFTYANHVVPMVRGVPRYSGPRRYPHQPNNLYRNRGDGTFDDVTAQSGIGARPGPGMGTVCADYDGDGDTDIFVANDTTTGNFLFRNDGGGKFTEVGLMAGVGFTVYGEAVSAMGADCGDYDNDGRLDFFVTDYQGEMPALFRNLGRGAFEDVTMLAGTSAGGLNNVKWGCGLVDLDNDGLRDIFFACGHIDDNIELTDRGTSYPACPVLLRNLGNGKFANVSDRSGDGLRLKLVGRGVAFDDLDNDGRIDVVILASRGAPAVLRNQSPGGNHWLQVELRGVKTNRDGVGARVQVVAGDLVQIDEVHSGRGYQSHWGSRLHFGLGKRDRVDRVVVRWIGGGVDVLEDLAADQRMTIVEGVAKNAKKGDESETSRSSRTPGASEVRDVPLFDTRIAALRKEAFEAVDALVAALPGAPEPLAILARAHHRFGASEEASRCWRRALEIRPGFAAAYAGLGVITLERGEYETAAMSLRKATELDPALPDVRPALADALINLGRAAEAAAILEADVRLFPASASNRYHLGQAYCQLGEHQKAVESFNAAVRVDPQCAYAYYGLSNAYRRLGDAKRAAESMEQFKRWKGKDLQTQRRLTKGFNDELEVRKSVASIHLAVANLYARVRRPADAEAHWLRAAKVSADDRQSRSLLAAYYVRENRLREAAAQFEELRKIEPGNPFHHLNLGLVYARLDNAAGAEEAFRGAIRAAPKSAAGYRELAQAHLKAGRNLAEAVELARKAAELENVASSHALHCAACERTGDRAGALTAIDRALDLDPGNLDYHRIRDRLGVPSPPAPLPKRARGVPLGLP